MINTISFTELMQVAFVAYAAGFLTLPLIVLFFGQKK
jgi:hypothetical protein